LEQRGSIAATKTHKLVAKAHQLALYIVVLPVFILVVVVMTAVFGIGVGVGIGECSAQGR
jgi:hypothetical protein